MDKAKLMNGVKKYTMIIVLVLVTLFFTWQTGGKILLPQNVSNLISQNAYVFVLATGMLLCTFPLVRLSASQVLSVQH